jgi:hypothetical protein
MLVTNNAAIPVIPWEAEADQEFKASLGYILITYLKKKKNHKM